MATVELGEFQISQPKLLWNMKMSTNMNQNLWRREDKAGIRSLMVQRTKLSPMWCNGKCMRENPLTVRRVRSSKVRERRNSSALEELVVRCQRGNLRCVSEHTRAVCKLKRLKRQKLSKFTEGSGSSSWSFLKLKKSSIILLNLRVALIVLARFLSQYSKFTLRALKFDKIFERENISLSVFPEKGKLRLLELMVNSTPYIFGDCHTPTLTVEWKLAK